MTPKRDIVERLCDIYAGHPLVMEAAKEIKRLREAKLAWQDVAKNYGAAIDRLRQFLPPD